MSDFLSRDPFAVLLGVVSLAEEPGYAKVSMELRQEHKNGVDMAHGGVIFSLADLAFAMAANAHGIPALAVTANISYLRPGRGGRLFAEAREVALSRKLATYTVTVTDEAGETVALFQGTVYRRSGPSEGKR